MIGKKELASIRVIGSVIIFLAVNWTIARGLLDQFFGFPPYINMALSAGTFISLYQVSISFYIHHFWRYQQRYLGGKWAYKVYWKDEEHESANPWFYGIFEMIYTAHKVEILTGKTWPSGKEPDMENIHSRWKSDVIMHRDRKLWMEAIATDHPFRKQLMALTVEGKNSQLTMNGDISGVLDSRGEGASGRITMIKIPKQIQTSAEKFAYDKYGFR